MPQNYCHSSVDYCDCCYVVHVHLLNRIDLLTQSQVLPNALSDLKKVCYFCMLLSCHGPIVPRRITAVSNSHVTMTKLAFESYQVSESFLKSLVVIRPNLPLEANCFQLLYPFWKKIIRCFFFLAGLLCMLLSCFGTIVPMKDHRGIFGKRHNVQTCF